MKICRLGWKKKKPNRLEGEAGESYQNRMKENQGQNRQVSFKRKSPYPPIQNK